MKWYKKQLDEIKKKEPEKFEVDSVPVKPAEHFGLKKVIGKKSFSKKMEKRSRPKTDAL
ncbi:MAG: hypothetical protein WC725_04390 [Patescibacteria group bacterium]|jgi:hypothetical protein